MDSIRVPTSKPALDDGTSIEPKSLSRRVRDYCQERRDHRRHDWETHKKTLKNIQREKRKTVSTMKPKGERCYIC